MRKTLPIVAKILFFAFALVCQSFYFKPLKYPIVKMQPDPTPWSYTGSLQHADFRLLDDVSIVNQPISQTGCVSSNVSFAVVANNAETYQWQVNQGAGFANISNTGRYSNANTATLNITGLVGSMNNYVYRCVMTGTGNPATSNPATLTVYAQPAITVNPFSSNVCEGDQTLFYVVASSALNYQWQVDMGTGFTNISDGAAAGGGSYINTNSAVMYVSNPTPAMSGYSYRCVVGGYCTPNANSNGATLTVYENKTYYEDYDGDGYGNAAVTTISCTGAPGGFVTNSSDCNDNDPSVHMAAAITSSPSNTTVCAGSNTTFSVTASSGVTYQWQVNSGSGFVNISNTGFYSNATTATLDITAAGAYMSGYSYRCIVTNNCSPAAVSTSATLLVNAAPSINQHPFASTVCEGDAILMYVSASNATGLQWQVNDGSGYVSILNGVNSSGASYSGANSGVLIIYNPTVAMSGYTYRCVASGFCSPNAVSNGAAITIYTHVTYYEDADGDGYGNPAISTSACTGPPLGYVSNAEDCDDLNSTVYPGAVEICGDGIDNNCNGQIDEDCGTQLQSAQCGTTLATIETNVNADAVASATQYRFRVIHGATVQTIDRATPTFKMTELAVFEYNTTYSIDVAVELNGSFGPYGSTCNITTALYPCGVWIGAASSDWSNAANWSCGLPTASTNVIIRSDALYMPIIDITSAACNNLTIEAGASLGIGTDYTLSINGAITNNGSFSAAGKITLSGENQTLPGGTYDDVEITGTGTKTLGGEVTISGTLTLSTSLLQLGNHHLIITSTGDIMGANNAGYIITNGTGAVKQQNLGTGGHTGPVVFPIGTATSYTPIVVNNAGISDEFSARVIDGIYNRYENNDMPDGTPQTVNNVNKTWLLEEGTAGGSNVTLLFQWNTADELPSFNRTMAVPSHYKNGYWHPGTYQAAAGTDPYTISITGVTSFSPFGVGSFGSVLPLHLLSFTGRQISNGIYLQWTTAQEENTANFEIERAVNGGRFVKIGSVVAGVSGAYSYTDNDLSGTNYTYRLKMRDRDGKFTYSQVINVHHVQKATVAYLVYPTPTTGSYLYVKPVKDNNTTIQIAVVDLSGSIRYNRTLAATNLNGGQFEIPVSQLSKGGYILRISDKNGHLIQVTKFIVD